MAVLQSKLDEIRYLKRQNIEEEAKIIGNYYRDIIRQFSIDCNYYKVKFPYFEHFRSVLDNNNIILHAYGVDSNPDYSISSDMLTYMEVDTDMFQLNKYGVIPKMDVNFYFDSHDFACSLAYKMGELKEYKIKEQNIIIEVPSYEDTEKLPIQIGYREPRFYESDILSGRYCVQIDSYEPDKEYTVMCKPYSHSDVDIRFPVNDTIYKSFDHVIKTNEFVDHIMLLTFKISEIKTASKKKYVLNGRLHGAVLFHDINKIGKYLELIHPEIGDIVTIDFPDSSSRQQFEITDCYDKNLGNDGINPLLHQYVWKCKATRYVNSGEDFPEQNEANEIIQEKKILQSDVEEKLDREISSYDEKDSDKKYGGYEKDYEEYDRDAVDTSDKNTKFDFIDDGSFIRLYKFYDESKLETDGYDLYFVDKNNKTVKLTMIEEDEKGAHSVPSGLQYIKASDNALFFVNFENEIQMICEDKNMTGGEVEMCLNSLLDASYNKRDPNREGNYFFKFKDSETVLISVNDNLYCRFGNKQHKLIKLT